MVVAKRQRKENAPQNGTKVNVRTRVRISGETNSPPGWPNLHKAGPGGGEKKKKTYKKRSQDLASPLGSARPHALRVYSPLLAE